MKRTNDKTLKSNPIAEQPAPAEPAAPDRADEVAYYSAAERAQQMARVESKPEDAAPSGAR